MIFLQFIPKAHEHEEAEHGVLEVIDQPHGGVLRLGGGGGAEAVHEDGQHPAPGGGVASHAGGVEDLMSQVAAEKPPRRAVGGAADGLPRRVEVRAGRRRAGAVGEDGAVLDKRLVGEGVAADEDEAALGDLNRHDGAVEGLEAAEDLLEVGDGLAQPYRVADEGDGRRPRRKVLAPRREEEGE